LGTPRHQLCAPEDGSIAIMRMDQDMEEILRDLPAMGRCFRICEPSVQATRHGVQTTLHWTWHQRRLVAQLSLCLGGTGKDGGLPERFAQVNLGTTAGDGAGVFAQSTGGNAVVERIRATTEGHHWKPEHRTSAKSVAA